MQTLWRKFGFLLTVLAVSIAFCLPARAYQEQSSSESPTHITQYKAYMAALEAGDRDAAARHSKAAWEAAEETLGDHQLTAILAFNYAQLVFISDPEGALIALERADALVQMGLVELPETELKLYIAYTEYEISDFRRKESRILRKALITSENLNPNSMTMDEASMWYRLSRGDIKSRKYRLAVQSSDKAEAIVNRLDPDNIDFMARILLIRSVAKLMPVPRSTNDIIAAHEDMDRAYRLPPPQKDFESFDPIFAQIVAWDAAIHAAMRGQYIKKGLPGTSEEPRPIFESEIGAPENCGLEWLTRPKPRYPNMAGYRSYIGAVMIVYDISDAGEVVNSRVLSEVPAELFSGVVLKSVNSWRIKTMPIDHPGCRTNQMTQFEFVIEE